ncbi:TadE/TadG family type IV pilus assembly protein [Melissospora conviva]|uniref:TadE/TadG family type IV pilus assembly protein n=1 Tax=Melissospora conviva TaxID=3388432 RepID=UPI003B79056C
MTRRTPAQRDRGASPVELAITMPAILLLLFASIQVAAVFLARSVALNAAQIGVNATRVLDGVDEAEGEAQAREFVAGAGDWLTLGTVEASRGEREVTVTVSGEALSLLPGVRFPVSQTAHGPVERFTEPAP